MEMMKLYQSSHQPSNVKCHAISIISVIAQSFASLYKTCKLRHAEEHVTVRLKATMKILNSNMTVYASDIMMNWGTILI